MPAQVIREESFSPAKHMQALQQAEGTCVSIYLPLNGAQEGTTLFSTRMKAALKRAGKRLADEFGEQAAIEWPPEELTRYAGQLRRGPQQGGIAVFSCNGHTRILYAPKMWKEAVHAGREYYIRPLLSLLMRPPAFYLLTLNEQNRRLLLCTPEGAEEIKLPGAIPGNMDEATRFKQPDHRLEHGSASGPKPGDERGIRFGTSADDEKHDIYLRQFFAQLDASLRPLLTNQQYPLMLAGVKRELALYDSVNTYENLLDHHVEGSPSWLSSNDLHELAKNAWEMYQQTIENDILEDLKDADSKAKMVKDVLQVLAAVESGKVHHLVLPEHMADDAIDDMINHLAIAALRQRTRISVFSNQAVPGGCAAGILRYGRNEKHPRAKAS